MSLGYCNLGNAVKCVAMFDAQLFLLFIDALGANGLTGLMPSEVGLMTSLTLLSLSESIVEPGTLQSWQCCECIAMFDAQLFLFLLML